MPIYEYECDACGIRFERVQRITEDPLKTCPDCGGHVHRVLQPVGIIFKGSGFYVTDHRAPSPTAVPGEAKSNGNGRGKNEEKATESPKSGENSKAD